MNTTEKNMITRCRNLEQQLDKERKLNEELNRTNECNRKRFEECCFGFNSHSSDPDEVKRLKQTCNSLETANENLHNINIMLMHGIVDNLF